MLVSRDASYWLIEYLSNGMNSFWLLNYSIGCGGGVKSALATREPPCHPASLPLYQRQQREVPGRSQSMRRASLKTNSLYRLAACRPAPLPLIQRQQHRVAASLVCGGSEFPVDRGCSSSHGAASVHGKPGPATASPDRGNSAGGVALQSQYWRGISFYPSSPQHQLLLPPHHSPVAASRAARGECE